MRCKHIAANNAFGEGYNNYFTELIRQFKCTCCCLRRPDVSITLKEGGINLGTIKEPCTCCSPILEVYGPGELGSKDITLRHIVYIDCCQPTYMCYKCTCGKLQELECNIYDGKDKDLVRKTGRLIKKVSVKEFFSKANVFCIDFPENATALDRMNLIFCGLFIDYFHQQEQEAQSLTAENWGTMGRWAAPWWGPCGLWDGGGRLHGSVWGWTPQLQTHAAYYR